MPVPTNLDLDLLRAFAAVADAKSFSRASERLLRNQSTVSLQIKRLEDAVGHRLLNRTPRSVRLTAEGETMLIYAHQMLELNDRAVARLNEPHMVGEVRLGAPEDFATRHLSGVLASFSEAYPSVSLQVTCDLTLNLLEQFRKNAFDVVLIKREPAATQRGVRVWREPLVWIVGTRDLPPAPEPIPLVVSPEPCVYRKRATAALSRAGPLAAVHANLGVSVLPKDMVPESLRIIDRGPLPSLADTEIALLGKAGLSRPAERLKEHIIRSMEHAGLAAPGG
jgi:DNA-binding transcriptional LysR family regulator